MSVARVWSRTDLGVDVPAVQVELHVGAGLPSFSIVGLPAQVVRESRERVRAALLSSGFRFPSGRIIANLAPVELAKRGSRFDLPIAVALLIASGQLRNPAFEYECYGELGLGGELKAVGGLFLASLQAHRAGRAVLVPAGNRAEVVASGQRDGCAAPTLREAVRFLFAGAPRGGLLPKAGDAPAATVAPETAQTAAHGAPKLSDIVGHHQAKRALIIAAAGGHSLLMVGPPGSGKSLLAACLPGLLPPLSAEESLEVASIASVAGLAFEPHGWCRPPYRTPHHTASASAIVGGGPRLTPGEISLAHRGVLFLDELPEFDRRVLEALRQPLEVGYIDLARASASLTLPARFQLLAAMNPCPCGHHGDAQRACRCSTTQVLRYRQRVSGPLLDRIDLHLHVPRLRSEEWRTPAAAAAQELEDAVQQVRAARCSRLARSGRPAAQLPLAQLEECCALSQGARQLLQRCAERLQLSGRGVQRLLAVSRTIADLAHADTVLPQHLAEAAQLRRPL